MIVVIKVEVDKMALTLDQKRNILLDMEKDLREHLESWNKNGITEKEHVVLHSLIDYISKIANDYNNKEEDLSKAIQNIRDYLAKRSFKKDGELHKSFTGTEQIMKNKKPVDKANIVNYIPAYMPSFLVRAFSRQAPKKNKVASTSLDELFSKQLKKLSNQEASPSSIPTRLKFHESSAEKRTKVVEELLKVVAGYQAAWKDSLTSEENKNITDVINSLSTINSIKGMHEDNDKNFLTQKNKLEKSFENLISSKEGNLNSHSNKTYPKELDGHKSVQELFGKINKYWEVNYGVTSTAKVANSEFKPNFNRDNNQVVTLRSNYQSVSASTLPSTKETNYPAKQKSQNLKKENSLADELNNLSTLKKRKTYSEIMFKKIEKLYRKFENSSNKEFITFLEEVYSLTNAMQLSCKNTDKKQGRQDFLNYGKELIKFLSKEKRFEKTAKELINLHIDTVLYASKNLYDLSTSDQKSSYAQKMFTEIESLWDKHGKSNNKKLIDFLSEIYTLSNAMRHNSKDNNTQEFYKDGEKLLNILSGEANFKEIANDLIDFHIETLLSFDKSKFDALDLFGLFADRGNDSNNNFNSNTSKSGNTFNK